MSDNKQTSTTATTTAPPANVQAAYDSTLQQAQQTASQPLQLYQGNLVAPLNSTQTGAISDIAGDQGIAAPYLSQAQADIAAGTNQITPGTNPVSASINPITATPFSAAAVGQYESPYTSDVVNSTEQQLQLQDAQQQQALQGNAVASGAYGGDRSAVLQSSLGGQQDVANNATIANLENTGYQQALGEFNTQQQTGLATQEATNQEQQQQQALGLQEQQLGVGVQEANNSNLQGAGYALGALGSEAQNTALTGASAALNAGTLEQQLAQEQLNVPYEQYLQQQAYPYQQEDFLSGIETGLGSLSGGTSTAANSQTTTPSLLTSLSSLGIKRGGRIPLQDGSRRHLDDGGGTGQPQGPTPLQLAQMNPVLAQELSANNVSNGAPAGSTVTAPVGLGQTPNPGINQTAAASLLNVPNISPTPSAKRGGRIGLDSGGSSGLSPSYLEMMEANQIRGTGANDAYTPLPGVPQDTSYIGNTTGYVPSSGWATPGRSTLPTANASMGNSGGSGGNTASGPNQSNAANLVSAYNGISSFLNPANPYGNTPLSDMGTGGSGAGNVYLDAAGNVTAPFDLGSENAPLTGADVGEGGFSMLGSDIGSGLSSAGSSLLSIFAKKGGRIPLQDAAAWYKRGGRIKLADGGDATVDDILNSLYPGPGADDALAQLADAQPTGAGATLMAADQVPDAWAQAATHMAPPAPGGGQSLESAPLAGPAPPGGQQLGGPPVPAGPPPSAPVWDDGVPVGAHERDITPAYRPQPSMGRALLSGLAGAFAGGHGLNVGQGISSGINSYYAEQDKDNHPMLDNSGPTTVIRNADGTVFDTGRPTEAAINAKAMNDYRMTNMDTVNATRQAAIDERAQAARDAVQQRADAAHQADLDRQEQLKIAGINAGGSWTYAGTDPKTNFPVLLNNRTGETKLGNAPIAAKPTADPGIGLGATPPPGSPGADVHGDAYLQTLPPAAQSVVKAMVEGRQPPPTSFAMSRPYWQQMIQAANQYDPGFDQTTWPGRVATRRSFTAGPDAANITAIDTALQHAGVVQNALGALNNTSVPAYNTAKNWLAKAFGASAPTNANEAVDALASEGRKVFAATGGGNLTELENWQKNFPVNGSPEQQSGALSQFVNLLDSRMDALSDKYKRGMGNSQDKLNFLSPNARAVYTRLTGRQPVTEAASSGDQPLVGVSPALGVGTIQPPAAAINHLRQNPALRGDFDAKYGAGASARILGQ